MSKSTIITCGIGIFAVITAIRSFSNFDVEKFHEHMNTSIKPGTEIHCGPNTLIATTSTSTRLMMMGKDTTITKFSNDTQVESDDDDANLKY